MIAIIELGTRRFRVDLSAPISIGIRQSFDARQVNHFGAELASRVPIRMGGFVGSTKLGGSCNVDQVRLIPHCNGTHVEHLGHIVDSWSGHPFGDIPTWMWALVISVRPTSGSDVGGDSYRPELDPADRVLTAAGLASAWRQVSLPGTLPVGGLVLRTLPNEPAKLHARYGDDAIPPFLTVQATEWIKNQGIHHLLVDFPSIDRLHDQGLLTNHHLFWNIPEESHSAGAEADARRSITELIFVPDQVPDGLYLLNLQFVDWDSDAAPARPILFAVGDHDDQS